MHQEILLILCSSIEVSSSDNEFCEPCHIDVFNDFKSLPVNN